MMSIIRVMRQMARNGPESEHPALFPVQLPEQLIASFSGPGSVICDPFLGSGTTGIAALSLSRRFIGIEIHESYFNLALRRIALAANQQKIPLGD